MNLIGELTLVAEPATEPIDTDDELKTHLRIDHNEEDDLLDGLVEAARKTFEEMTHRALITQTWRYTLDAWPDGRIIALPRPPLQSVSSISYVDEDGNESTWGASNYVVDVAGGRIALAASANWPSVSLYPIGAIRITYVAGYGAAGSAVPRQMRQAIKLLVGHWYENREATMSGAIAREVPMGLKALIYLNRAY